MVSSSVRESTACSCRIHGFAPGGNLSAPEDNSWIATVRAGGELIAAAPMMRTRVSMYGFKVASIESIYNPHTPRFDFIVEKPCDEIYRAIWSELSRIDDCDMVLLSQIVETSPTLGTIAETCRRRWVAYRPLVSATVPVHPFGMRI